MMNKGRIGMMMLVFAVGMMGMRPLYGEKDEGRARDVTVVMQEMRETARQLVSLRAAQYREGVGDIDGLVAAQRKLREVELRLAPDAAARRKILAESVQAAKETEMIVRGRVDTGTARQAEFLEARLDRMTAELALLEEGKQGGN